MIDNIKNILNLPRLHGSDKRAFTRLLLMITFYAGFWIIYEIYAISEFLSVNGSDKLHMGIAFSALATALTYFIAFTLSNQNVTFNSEYLLSLLILLLISLGTAMSITQNEYLTFINFAFVIPINIFSVTFFNSIIERHTPNHIKTNIYALIDFLKYSCVAFFSAISLTLLYLFIPINIIFYVGAVSGLAFIVVYIIILAKLPAFKPSPRIDSKGVLKSILKTKASGFILMAFFVGTLINIFFFKEAYITYQSIWGISKLLSLYFGTLYIFIYAAQRILLPRLLNTFHSPYSLVTSSLMIILMSILATLYFWLASRYQALNNFSIPVLVVLIIKTLYENSRINVDIPSLKVSIIAVNKYYQPTEVMAIAIMGSIGVLLASVVELALLNITNKIIYYSISIGTIGLLWLFVTALNAKEFTKLINGLLNTKTEDKTRATVLIDRIIYNQKLFDPDLYNFFSRIYPDKYNRLIEKLLASPLSLHQKYAIQHINRLNYDRALNILSKENLIHNPNHSNISDLIIEIEKALETAKNKNEIEALSESKIDNERLKAAQLINYNDDTATLESPLISLLKDINPDVKREAIFSAVQSSSSEVSYLLVDYFSSDEYYPYAFHALKDKGDSVTEYIDQLLKHEVLPDKLIIRIIKLYERMATFKSVDKICEFIEHPSREVMQQTVKSLRMLRYKPTEQLTNKIYNQLVKQCNIISWNISITHLLFMSDKHEWLRNAMEKEIYTSIEDMFLLLEFIYPVHIIQKAKEYYDLNTEVARSYASELLDSVLQEDLKKVILPLISSLGLNEKVRHLQFYYTLEDNTKDILPAIFYRDFNYVSSYTKSIAIYSLMELDDIVLLEDELISLLFHENHIISETAAYVIVKKFHYLLKRVFPRLNLEKQQEIFLMNLPEYDPEILQINKLNRLNQHTAFKTLNNSLLFKLVENTQFIQFFEGEDIDLLKRFDDLIGFIFVLEGQISLFINGDRKGVYGHDEIVFTELSDQDAEDLIILRAKENTKLIFIDKVNFEKLNFDYGELFTSLCENYFNTKNLSLDE